ncbi:MAG: XrtA-associated tyrosine autokinase, partial [Steroidobacteraceae bacterium]
STLPAPVHAPASRLAPGVIGELVHTGVPRVVEKVLGAPVYRSDTLIRVDRRALRAEGLMPPEHQERVLADQYRQIKRPLIANAVGAGVPKLAHGQLIMMASAMPGEGKTFTSINLALSMALEKDVSVLLVDADVAKPHISRTFGVEHEPGLLDVLREESAQVDSFVIPTDVPGLSILPAGRRSDTATELLASRRMQQVAHNLAERDPSRLALIDSPPLLLTSESRALAQSVGQIVVVVRAGFTPQQAVLDGISYLGEGKFIGLVLNQSTVSAPGGYYYGYGEIDKAPVT